MEDTPEIEVVQVPLVEEGTPVLSLPSPTATLFD